MLLSSVLLAVKVNDSYPPWLLETCDQAKTSFSSAMSSPCMPGFECRWWRQARPRNSREIQRTESFREATWSQQQWRMASEELKTSTASNGSKSRAPLLPYQTPYLVRSSRRWSGFVVRGILQCTTCEVCAGYSAESQWARTCKLGRSVTFRPDLARPPMASLAESSSTGLAHLTKPVLSTKLRARWSSSTFSL